MRKTLVLLFVLLSIASNAGNLMIIVEGENLNIVSEQPIGNIQQYIDDNVSTHGTDYYTIVLHCCNDTIIIPTSCYEGNMFNNEIFYDMFGDDSKYCTDIK